MLLPIAYYPEAVLLKKGERINHIDDDLRQLVSNMIETMHANNGIGLAAPQVFHSITLFVKCVPFQGPDGRWYRGKNRVYINPEVISACGETELSEEGCLSIPNISVSIQRPSAVRVRATDLTGQKFEETLEGLSCYNFFHEYDHLQGILTLDYLSPNEREKIEEQIRQNQTG